MPMISPILTKLQEDHDRDPQAAAAALRAIRAADVPREEMARYTWLVNHVIGEKLGSWGEVRELYRCMTCGFDELPAAALRNLAAAAALYGDPDAAAIHAAALRRIAGITEAEACVVVEMATLMYGMPMQGLEHGAGEFARLCGVAMEWKEATGADTLVAGTSNNVVSAWLEMPPGQWRSPPLARAMELGARTSRHFWSKAGTWTHKARADYLLAMVMNRLNQPREARSHCLSAIAAIEGNGKEDVDMAFIALELAHAERLLGNEPQAAAARARAQALAANFANDSLTNSFGQTAATLEALNENSTVHGGA